MGNNASQDKQPYRGKNLLNTETDGVLDVQVRNIDSVSENGVVNNNLQVSPASPMNATTEAMFMSATSDVPFTLAKKQLQMGGYVESEIDIQIENMEGGNISEINLDTESSIQVETETFDNNLQSGGAREEFDSNKLLDIIMQMGGDNESDSDSDMTASDSSMPSDLNTSSYNPKNKNKQYTRRELLDDSGSDSESSSSSSSSSNSDSSSSSSDSDSDKPLTSKNITSHVKKAITNSDVYIMSETDSASPRNISLISFNDPLKNKKNKNKNKRK
jgi:hypothetical protein